VLLAFGVKIQDSGSPPSWNSRGSMFAEAYFGNLKCTKMWNVRNYRYCLS